MFSSLKFYVLESYRNNVEKLNIKLEIEITGNSFIYNSDNLACGKFL